MSICDKLEKDMSAHHSSAEFKCLTCAKSYRSQLKLLLHLHHVHEQRKFKCFTWKWSMKENDGTAAIQDAWRSSPGKAMRHRIFASFTNWKMANWRTTSGSSCSTNENQSQSTKIKYVLQCHSFFHIFIQRIFQGSKQWVIYLEGLEVSQMTHTINISRPRVQAVQV